MQNNDSIVFGKEITFHTAFQEVSKKQNIRYTNKVIKAYKKTVIFANIFNFDISSSRMPAFMSIIEGFIKNHFKVGQSVSFANFEANVIQKDDIVYLHIKDLENNTQNTFTKVDCDYIFKCYEIVSKELSLFGCVPYTQESIETIA